ncbi:hypothetical protein D9V87_05145 [Bacteroidetes/Chlorobi group bacterium MS-B_bin-24]|jgi:tetratricopeptide (TPR) repeat protein|nr:MAG: hypothetical protein D9V87_06565 [Bacteroidetes/Chlorobi group bacterium MS-B_bin-24]ROL59523.1 MAG: hypothetical protein D9V87_05145 [Bacteroidetes/Chlorobi group bacterium MS-B_bin-24]
MGVALDPIAFVENVSNEFNSGNYERVIELCKEGIHDFGEFPLLYFFLSKSYLKLQKHNDAREVIEIAFRKFPFNRSIAALKDEIESAEVVNTSSSLSTQTDVQKNSVEFEHILKNTFIFHFHSNLDKLFNNPERLF